jgi:transposase
MNIHKNARTTPRSRGQIVQRVLTQEERPPVVAAAVGVSDRTVRKWVARYAAEAEAGLADRSCRPRRSPCATPPLLVRWVERLRRQRWTGTEIAQALPLSASTGARLLRRQGLARLRQPEPPAPVQRYQWAQPGALLHLDVKKLGRIGRIGHRITGDRRAQVRGIGWEFVHVAVDDASRLAYVEVLPDEGGVTATQFLWRARAWFRRHGIRIRRVLTDNGPGYVSDRFARLCRSAGVRHRRTRPRAPTARRSASSKPCCASGPTAALMRARASGPTRCPLGCTTTIGRAPMARSTVVRPSHAWRPRTISWQFKASRACR